MAHAEFDATLLIGATPIYDGQKGNMEIRTDPATVVGVGYVHITQIDAGALGGDFVAIGTANGLGVANCAHDYDSEWTGYYDAQLGQTYICEDFSPDAWDVGDNPTFEIRYANCSGPGTGKWLMYFAGVFRACISTGTGSARALVIGLETTGGSSTDRNIDVKYTNMQKNLVGSSTWSNLGGPNDLVQDPSYQWQYVSDTAQNFYLAPLN